MQLLGLCEDAIFLLWELLTMTNKMVVESVIQDFGLKAGNTGSTEVQVALLTKRINVLTPHLDKFKKDHSSKRGMMRLIGQRRSLLRYLSETSPERYQQLLAKLGLRK
jgi:small subunit ribosomal protein S15